MTPNTQILTIKPGHEHSIRIETPMGLIVIERLTGDSRKFKITLPNGLKAVSGKSVEGLYVKETDGNLTPVYEMLVPLLDADGKLVGAAKPTAFQLID